MARHIAKTKTIYLLLAGLCIAAACSAGPAPADTGGRSATVYPPWCSPPQNGVDFTIRQIDDVPDLHGDIVDAQLVIFFAGNQFMVVPDLIKAFKQAYPQYTRIYAETLPPGLLAKTIDQGALIVGNLRIAIQPDVFTAGKGRIENLQKEKNWFDESSIVHYARNKLAIMVRKGNPGSVHSLEDLRWVNVSMPNPKIEGIANRIIAAYKKAGGQNLVDDIMDKKKKAGTTFLTHIHHRQTPVRILLKQSDAGPVWFTEAKFQEKIGNPIVTVEIPDNHNVTAVYTAAAMKNAPHKQAAKDFLTFLMSAKGQSIYRDYHFMAPQ